MSVTFTPNVPQATQTIAATQQIINDNFQCLDNSVNGFTVDHYTMTNTPLPDGGKHKQVTFNANNVPTLPTSPRSVLYTNNTATGADPSNPSLFWTNPNGIFQINPIKAWAWCNGTGGIKANQSFNVASVSAGTTSFSVVLTANAVRSGNFAVFVTTSVASGFGGVASAEFQGITGGGQGTFQINTYNVNTGSPAQVTDFSFMVIQI